MSNEAFKLPGTPGRPGAALGCISPRLYRSLTARSLTLALASYEHSVRRIQLPEPCGQMDDQHVPPYYRTPQPLYKYLPEQHAIGLVEHGSLRIGTAHDFRRTEIHNPARGDPREASPYSSAVINGLVLAPDTPGLAYVERFVKFMTPAAALGSRIVIDEAPQLDQDYYVYCLTAQHRWQFYDAFGATRCVRINDVQGFVDCLATHVAPNALGFDWGRVTYGRRHGPLGEAHDRPPPFVKSPKYSWQDEIRLVWLPKRHVVSAPFNTVVPGIRHFCDLMPRRPAFAASHRLW